MGDGAGGCGGVEFVHRVINPLILVIWIIRVHLEELSFIHPVEERGVEFVDV